MPDARARLASVEIGGGAPVVVMGVINVSPESFHPGSVYRGEAAVLEGAYQLAAQVDPGAQGQTHRDRLGQTEQARPRVALRELDQAPVQDASRKQRRDRRYQVGQHGPACAAGQPVADHAHRDRPRERAHHRRDL